MPRLSQAEIRNNAISFVHEWKDEARERAEAQTFWNEFLSIFGVKRRQVAVFEKAVQKNNLNTGAIDLFWRGVLLVEHKSRGQNLDKATSQAFEYLENLGEDELPELVLISDFERFRLFNLETGEERAFTLAQVPDVIHLFGAISGYQKREYKEQDPVNLRVALKLGELHDALLESGYTGHKLEVLLVRLVYCLFADDTGIFLPRSSFLFLLEERTAENGSDLGANLAQLFQVLDTPEAERQKTLDDELRAFPHVNGSLFADRFDLPFFNRHMRRLVIEACGFDWSKVSPAIFGSLFQSVMDKEKRRNLGAHYTSEKNILKVIHGLFLDDLLAEFEAVKNSLARLRAFHEKIAGIRFFDPACGSGNFLVITYREMRRLELEVVKQKAKLSGDVQSRLLVADLSKIDVNSFYGIEYEEFPAEIARVALWLTDHLANMELSAEFGVPYTRLPLENTPNIVHGNALRLDWMDVIGGNTSGSECAPVRPGAPEGTADHVTALDGLYILGNPPFVGGKMMNADQRADMALVCSDVPNYGLLDYVCGWYVKAAKLLTERSTVATGFQDAEGKNPVAIAPGSDSGGRGLSGGEAKNPVAIAPGSDCRVAFVSTNSITQGEQVGVLWSYLLSKGVKINFAHRTFKWSNEAAGKAAVYCVIVGFALSEAKKKRLFDYEDPRAEAHEIAVSNINPYLVDAPDVVISRRHKPISAVPEMKFGNMPLDGGNLLISSRAELYDLLTQDAGLYRYVKKFTGSDEFINSRERWCLWFVGVEPTELRSMSEAVRRRIDAVRTFRLNSKAPSTQRFAETPYLFRDRNLPSRYLIVPSVSSERRRFIPIGFATDDTVASNLCLIVPDAGLYHFGVMTSTMHNAWMRQVCGRLKSDYRYSKDIVYNNFPWPESAEPRPSGGGQSVGPSNRPAAHAGGTDKRAARVEATAQGILDARAKFPEATLADLYDPLTMPKELLDAHRANDEAVDACYGRRGFRTELERLEFLFDLYRRYTEPLALADDAARRKRRK